MKLFANAEISLQHFSTSALQHFSTSALFRRAMLALCLACAISVTGIRAQSNTEYSFRQQSVADGQSYGETGGAGTGDAVPVLSMDCLAANGYGQWTLSSSTGQGTNGATTYPAGWYLLANGLYTPSTHYDAAAHDPTLLTNHPECIPPGVVQNGQVVGDVTVGEPKATANLDGAETFVWPDQNPGTLHQDFQVQGFRQGSVDLSLSFLANPHPPMNVITSAITPFTSISTGTPLHTVVSTTAADEFDVCSDAAYLYITWCSSTNMSPGVGPSEIWWEVLDINTMAVVAGPTSAGSGMRPTIACDPRDNRNGGPAIHFDLAFIAPVAGSWLTLGGMTGGNPVWKDYNAGTWTTYPATVTVLLPAGGTTTYYMATHVRALVSSVAGGAWYPACYAIVEGFSGDVLSPVLILYNQLDPHIPMGQAAYVDGDVMPPYGVPLGNPNPTDPIPAPITPQIGWPVKDAPIVAFANPYDNQNISSDIPSDWQAYDQFHCLYQLDLSGFPGQPPNQTYPLLIVRNSDNGETNPLQPNPNGSTADTRLVLNQVEMSPPPPQPQLLQYPASYCAAVNQMGIHVHWRSQANEGSPVIHYYSRDMNRTFDEDIDENTLVTDQCTVSNGTGHGGRVGAKVDVNKEMTVWTDPNYGPPSIDGLSGLYSPPNIPGALSTINPYVGTLNFQGSNVALVVGGDNCPGSDIYNPCPAWLAVMPYFYFNFSGSGEAVNIEQNATFDYYGLLATHDGTRAQTGISTPFTDGTGDGVGAGTINLYGGYIMPGEPGDPAYLKVHGGADVFTGAGGSLSSDNGNISVAYESAIFPETNGSANSPATGHMTLLGQTSLYSGEVDGNIPYIANDPGYARRVIMTVDNGYTPGSGSTQFDASGEAFKNSDPNATSELLFGHANRSAGNSFETSTFESCTGDAIELHVVDPSTTSSLDIENCTFNNIRNRCIYIENDQDPITVSYGQITINGNTFGSFASDVADIGVRDANLLAPDGIYFRNFDAQAGTGWQNGTVPIISNNIFTYSGNYSAAENKWGAGIDYDGICSGAIHLENTTAMVLSNTISDNGYIAGIAVQGNGQNPPLTYSVICSNAISGMTDAFDEGDNNEIGLVTNYLEGQVSLNTITGCDEGYASYDNDEPYVYMNTISGNLEAQMDIGPDNHAHFSTYQTGSDPTLYAGAYNTFYGPDYTSEPNGNGDRPILALYNNTYTSLDFYNGQNNIYVDPILGTDLIFWGYGYAQLNDIDGNWWGSGVDPYTGSSPVSCNSCVWKANETNGMNIAYSASSGGVLGGKVTSHPSCSCPTFTGHAVAGRKGNQPLSIDNLQSDTAHYCDSLWTKINYYDGYRDWQDLYDSARAFVMHCTEDPRVGSMFGYIWAAAEQLAGRDTSMWRKYLSWMESVLYLNTSDDYFCVCVEHFSFKPTDTAGETAYWRQQNKGLALLRWLIQNTDCDTALLKANYNATRAGQYSDWRNDTTVLYDTTLLPLDSIEPGLQELLERHFLYAVAPEVPMPAILSNVSASPNPVNSGTVISFTMGKEAYVRITLYDVLGQQLGVSAFESLFQPGNKSVPISLAGLPAGTYYARLQTAYGEVQTVKLVKQ